MSYFEGSEIRIASPCQGGVTDTRPRHRLGVRVRIPGCPSARWGGGRVVGIICCAGDDSKKGTTAGLVFSSSRGTLTCRATLGRLSRKRTGEVGAASRNLDPHPALVDERRPDRERLLECDARDELDAGALTHAGGATSPDGRGIGAASRNLDPHPALVDERRPLPDRERLLDGVAIS